MAAGNTEGEAGHVGDLEDLCLFRRSVIQLSQWRQLRGREGEDLGAFPVNTPNAVGLEMRVLVYFALSHPCV